MICKEFEDWLITRDPSGGENHSEATRHLNTCTTCAAVYDMDVHLEQAIASALSPKPMPKGLMEQVDISLDHVVLDKPSRKKHPWLAAGLAAAVLIIFTYIFISPFQYKNLQDLTETAVARHLKGDTSLMFTADQMDSATAIMSRELKFNVILPDLTDQGYVLLGGRLCALGKCKIAYLFYEKADKVCSLFVLDYDHLAFEMADGSRFSNEIKGYQTNVWKENGQVYAMVY